MKFLKERSSEQEEMDNLNLSGEQLEKTLDGLRIINRFLGNTHATFRAVKPEILRANKPLKIIDLGCGGGDNLRTIAHWCARNGHAVELIGIDGNAYILDYASSKNSEGIHIKYQQANLLDPTFQLPTCDLLISSHFVYHFSDIALLHFLKNAKSRVSQKIIFSELRRSSLAYFLFKLGMPLFPFSKMVKADGLKAIRRSFTRDEITTILKKADLKKVTIQKKWAFRWEILISI